MLNQSFMNILSVVPKHSNIAGYLAADGLLGLIALVASTLLSIVCLILISIGLYNKIFHGKNMEPWTGMDIAWGILMIAFSLTVLIGFYMPFKK